MPASKSSERLLLAGMDSDERCLQDVTEELHRLPWFLDSQPAPSRRKQRGLPQLSAAMAK